MNNISVNLNLQKLTSVVMKMKSKSGQMIDCLIIPIAQNHLVLGEKGVYIDLQCFELKEQKPNQKDTHLVKQAVPKIVYDNMSEDERRAMPILGNAILWKDVNNSDIGGGINTGANPLEEGDDLPF